MIASERIFFRVTCNYCKIEREYPATKIKSSGSLSYIAPYVNCMSCNTPLYLNSSQEGYTRLTCPDCKRQAEYYGEDIDRTDFVFFGTPYSGHKHCVTCKYCRKRVDVTNQLH